MLKYVENRSEAKLKEPGVKLRTQNDILRLCLSVSLLGADFRSDAGEVVSAGNFANAYFRCTTITRAKPRRPTVGEDIYTGSFMARNLGSQRAASEPRDYIYATMSPFPWYGYPTNAEKLAFGELFLDLYNQAAENRHTFAPRITASMIQSSATDTSKAWLPSKQQPEPECLGDFLKLLGQRLATDIPEKYSCYHATTSVRVLAFERDTRCEVLPMIRSSIESFTGIWQSCRAGGELCKYGSYPDSVWKMDVTDATYMGCSPNPEKSMDPCSRAMEDEDPTTIVKRPSIEFTTIPAEIESTSQAGTVNRHVDYLPILEHSRSILGAAWNAWYSTSSDLHNETDFGEFQRAMEPKCSKQLSHTLILLTAMVNCQIGLSAARWVRKYFVPALIQYDKNNIVLGLLAKHTCSSGKFEVKQMMSVGRHLPGPSVGKDLVLVDLAAPSAPVGIIPDFCHGDARNEEFRERLRVLYNGVGKIVAPGRFNIGHMSPENYAAAIRKRMQENLVSEKDPDSDSGVLIPRFQCAPRGLVSNPLGLTLLRHKHNFSIRCLQLIWSREDGLFHCSLIYTGRAAELMLEYARQS